MAPKSIYFISGVSFLLLVHHILNKSMVFKFYAYYILFLVVSLLFRRDYRYAWPYLWEFNGVKSKLMHVYY